MTPKIFRSLARAGLGLVALTLLAGCAGAPRWGEWSRHPSLEQIAAVFNRPAPRVQYQPFAYGTHQK